MASTIPTSTDPRVLLALTLIDAGISTVAKLRDLWGAHGVSDAELDTILGEVERRLARRA